MAWNDDIELGKQKRFYLFIYDDNKMFYRANQQSDGSYVIVTQVNPYPIKYIPLNLLDTDVKLATNSRYFSMARSINFPLEFINDGAAIMRHLYYLGKGINQNAYINLIEYNTSTATFDLSNTGKVDFSAKDENPKTGTFTVPMKDNSTWGILSENDEVQFAIDCSRTNKRAVKVLMDGITLLNRVTYQTVQSPIVHSAIANYRTIPFVIVNQDGDSAGIILKSQSITIVDDPTFANENGDFASTLYDITGVNLSGEFTFIGSSNTAPAGGLEISFRTNLGQVFTIFSMPGSGGVINLGQIYTVPIDITLDLAAGEKIFFLIVMLDNVARNFTITPITTNVVLSTKTRPQPVVCYGLRALDLGKALVNKATKGKGTIDSEFLTVNNNHILMAGDSLRQIKGAKLYSSFADYFLSFSSLFFMALRDVNGKIWFEEAKEIYKSDTNIIDLGEAIEIKLTPATEYYVNEVSVGSPKQDFRHPSGRLEFNSVNTFSFPSPNQKGKKEIITKYRFGCYDSTFLIMDYVNNSSKDNSGDKSVYGVEITDDKGTTVEQIETFENINIDNALIEPIIKSPLNDEVLTYNKPVIRGVAIPNKDIFVYVDNVLDGSTTSDASGNWSYQVVTALQQYIPDIVSGIHIIDATFSTNSDPKASVSVTIDSTNATPLMITFPQEDDFLWNNKPLIEGVAEHGTTVQILLFGTIIGTVVADNSGKWSLKSGVITNGVQLLQVQTPDLSQIDFLSFEVNSSPPRPLITYVSSELDGFPIVNNLPLIQGVAVPGTVVEVWLNYVTYASLGTTTADANGNWSLQVVPVTYTEPGGVIAAVLAPIRNGLNIFSTSLRNFSVATPVTGYLLNRPQFTSITGVIDNTVYNTSYSPHRMMERHNPLWASILDKQPLEKIYFQTYDKNANLSTTDDVGVTVTENADIPASVLGPKLAILENATIKVRSSRMFIDVLSDFRNGGEIKVKFRGNDLKLLPIGEMKLNGIIDSVETWKLLLSPNNDYETLLNLSTNSFKIDLMDNNIYRSNYNSLHMVDYNFQQSPKYNYIEIDKDWFENRNQAWTGNPKYVQKYQTTEVLTDQLTIKSLDGSILPIVLRMYRASDAKLITTFPYDAVVAPTQPNYYVLEAKIDLGLFAETEYFFVMVVGTTKVLISEIISTKLRWPGTFLIEASNSVNLTGCFFSTGFKTIIRVEGLIKKINSRLEKQTATDNVGKTYDLYSIVLKKREIRYGTAYGLPDYLSVKIADVLADLNTKLIEGVKYVLGEDSSIDKSEDISGHPMNYYSITMYFEDNPGGKAFLAESDSDPNGVVIIVNGRAVGLPYDSVVNIDLENG